ncbi:Putrescine transporter PotE [Streptomyces griseomycini]
MWVVTGMAELTAAAIYINYWFPAIPQWTSALVFLIILFAANLISVKLFGEIEFWFSMIKVTAIIGMIVIGLGVLTLGFSQAGDTASVSNLWAFDGFFPKGIGSSLMTLQGVMFAYLAVELVGVTAGESENPEKTLPKAINTLPWRIALFYVGALTVILCVVKWTEFSDGVSPFVKAFAVIGIPAGAGIVNFVVLTAALSSCNSGMYSTGRMLRNLADNGEAPRVFQRLSSTKTPALGIATSVVFMGIGVVLNYTVPEKAFGYVTSVATAAGIWTWLMILVSHVLYRRHVVAGRLPASSFPAPGGSVCSYVAIAFLLFVTALIAIDADARICLYVMAGWAVALGIGWPSSRAATRRSPSAASRTSRRSADPRAGRPVAGSTRGTPPRRPLRASGIRAAAYHPSVRAGPSVILSPMLTIAQALYDKIVAHAREDHPDEACGVGGGPVGSGRPERFIPMLNAARSPTSTSSTPRTC